jgi:hypothetical protein
LRGLSSTKAKIPVDNAVQNGHMSCLWPLVCNSDRPKHFGWYLGKKSKREMSRV